MIIKIKEVKKFIATIELGREELQLLVDAVGDAYYDAMKKDGHQTEAAHSAYAALFSSLEDLKSKDK